MVKPKYVDKDSEHDDDNMMMKTMIAMNTTRWWKLKGLMIMMIMTSMTMTYLGSAVSRTESNLLQVLIKGPHSSQRPSREARDWSSWNIYDKIRYDGMVVSMMMMTTAMNRMIWVWYDDMVLWYDMGLMWWQCEIVIMMLIWNICCYFLSCSSLLFWISGLDDTLCLDQNWCNMQPRNGLGGQALPALLCHATASLSQHNLWDLEVKSIPKPE